MVPYESEIGRIKVLVAIQFLEYSRLIVQGSLRKWDVAIVTDNTHMKNFTAAALPAPYDIPYDIIIAS